MVPRNFKISAVFHLIMSFGSETECSSLSSQDRQIGSCITRSCDQTITQRDLSYETALRIIQEEEYLDLSEFQGLLKRRRRRKRQVGTAGVSMMMMMNMIGNLPNAIQRQMTNMRDEILRNPRRAAGMAAAAAVFPMAIGPMLGLQGGGFLGGSPPLGAPPPPPPPPPPPLGAPGPPSIFTGAGSGAPGTLGFSAGGAPLPGAFGAGAAIVGTSTVIVQAIALAPLGTTPVAAFPPFVVPRRIPAVCVLFREDNLMATSQDSNTINRLYKPPSQKHQRISAFKSLIRFFSQFASNNLFKRQIYSNIDNASKDTNGATPGFSSMNRFGYSCQITLEETCISDFNCRTNNIEKVRERQTGENFASSASAVCRTSVSAECT